MELEIENGKLKDEIKSIGAEISKLRQDVLSDMIEKQRERLEALNKDHRERMARLEAEKTIMML